MNVTQMIEKEKQRAAPHEYWRNEKNQSNENEDSEEVSVFDNCLTDTETTLSFLDLNSENTDLHKGNKHADQTKDIEDDSDNIASGSTFFDDFDETDYFDSEDEYWDTLRNKNIKEEVCQHCHSYHLPRSTKDIVPCKCCYIKCIFSVFLSSMINVLKILLLILMFMSRYRTGLFRLRLDTTKTLGNYFLFFFLFV